MKALGWITYFVFCAIGGSITYGWALSTLWGWFISPLGLPLLSIPQAIGVSITLGMFLANLAREDQKSKSDIDIIANTFGRLFLAPLLSVISGYIVTLFL